MVSISFYLLNKRWDGIIDKYVIQLIPVDDDIPLYLVKIRRSGLGMYSYDNSKAIIFDSYKEAVKVLDRLYSKNSIIKKLK